MKTINKIIKPVKHIYYNICNIFRWIPILWKDRDWDYCFMLYIERKKLENIIAWYEKNNYGHHLYGWHDYRNIKWAKACLDIFIDDYKWWTIDFDNINYFISMSQEDRNKTYIIKPYINLKNYKRFLPYLNQKAIENHSKHFSIELRKQKAWRLYHKIREQYMQDWWD